MQHRFSLLINSLPRTTQLIWAAQFCFRLNRLSLQGFGRRRAIIFAHCFSWGKCIDPIGLQVPSFTVCTAPSPLLLNKYIVKSLQVFLADSFNSYIYETKQHMLGLAIIRLSQVVYGSAHTSGELVSNLPCHEEISQGYDQHQAFHNSTAWAFIWSYLPTWTSKIPKDMCKAKTHTELKGVVLEMLVEQLGLLFRLVYQIQGRTPLKRLSIKHHQLIQSLLT